MSPTERTAVLLDEQPIWLDGVERVLERLGIRVVGKATAPEAALEMIEAEHPDVFVTAIELPEAEMDGLACVSQARERQPGLRAVVVSAFRDSDHIDAALDAGAAAYVIKTAHPDDLASAIRQAFEHSVFYAKTRRNAEPAPLHASLPDPPPDFGLTRRELEILQLVAEGRSNAQLAKMLWVTEQTVKFHLSNIYRKLNVANRTEASRWAQVQGLLPVAAGSAA